MINTHLIDLPTSVKGLSRENPDGTFTIILNAKLNFEQLQCTYIHELKHISSGDFDSEKSVDCIEYNAHLK